MVFPKFDFHGNSKGEDDIWSKMKVYLPENYVSFHNYCLDSQEVDWILLVPDFGVLIIEIKAFLPDSILYAIDNSNILLSNGNMEFSPYKQAKRYWTKLLSMTESDSLLSKVYVAKAVCYPYLTRQDVAEKKLTRICADKLIITKEDLKSFDELSARLTTIFETTYEVKIPGALDYGFDNEIKKAFANFISDGCMDECSTEQADEEFIAESDYSILYVRTDKLPEDALDYLFESWKRGTKVFFFSRIQDDIEYLKKKIKEYIDDIGESERLVSKTDIFNFYFGCSKEIEEDFEIVNGDNLEYFWEKLEHLGSIVPFNAEQYRVEHINEEDIIVKAGAGTGKTYLLVSRIAYLCWKKKYDENDILNKLILITFTNDATDEMKARLEAYYSKLFALTYSPLYFKYVESIENMRISTIDSLSLSIIKLYAYYLGLGTELSISNATLIKRDAIRKLINTVIEKNGSTNLLDSYQLQKIIKDIIDKFENRNVDLKTNSKIYFGEDVLGDNEITDYLMAIPETVESIEVECEKRNKITTGHIIVYLHRLASMMDSGVITPKKSLDVEHVFIDEFQDTDDTQIQLVALFKKFFKFDLFVVGDVKQSIYRFRGADDDKAFTTLVEKLGYTIKEYPLKKNYRTNSQLLEYMDGVFEKMSAKKLLKYSGDDKLVGVINPQIPASVVGINVVSEEEREQKIIDVIRKFEQEYSQKEGPKEEEKKKEKKLGILVRRRSEILKLREICAKNGIKNIDIDIGGKLYKSEAAIDLYKLLLALRDCGDEASIYNLYSTNYVKDCLDKTKLIGKQGALISLFSNDLPSSLSKWGEYLERLKLEPILKVLKEVTEDVKPWNIYAIKSEAPEEEVEKYALDYKANLDKLFEKIAIEFEGDYLTLNSLIDYLSIMIKTEQEEEERSTTEESMIQCRTVHRAKGKEYDWVFMPFSDIQITGGGSGSKSDYIIDEYGFGYRIVLSMDKETHKVDSISNSFYENRKKIERNDQSCEEARILYVAITRAKESIIFVKKISEKKSKDLKWQDLM
ncbi:ATP-dependent helicase [Butyrivibrio sp. AE3006]|uniref:ATP-dependent helicase n=1 Tax=Butyrivibrio sp. AE3006 TaxID=1280673 RepID=UPI00041C4BD1|nr:ATP-dependent helicase [Butyrivibrio sp. AE3006]